MPDSTVKFVGTVPEPHRAGSPGPHNTATKQLVAQLQQRPGEWAEIERVPRLDANRLRTRGSYLRRGHGLEYTVRTLGDETVLYARFVA